MASDAEIKALTEKIRGEGPLLESIFNEMGHRVVGQKNMLEKLMIGLLTGGHILLEGVPGLAKTLAVSTLSEVISVGFRRIQFTPDLLPSDLTGTLVYNQKTGSFDTKKGPIFSNIILADEINRAPAKVQSALLEAMQEKQVTIGEETFPLDSPFLVLATQNPVEQEGTYPLPEAQVDRFMLKVIVSYPAEAEEREIVKKYMNRDSISVRPVLKKSQLEKLRGLVDQVYVDERVMEYIVSLVFATREPERARIEQTLIAYGASPRASLYLAQAAKANALLQGRGFVLPEDIRMIGMDVLRHRVIPSYEAEAEGMTSETLVERVFNNVEVP